MIRSHAIANGCFVVAVNRVGREDRMSFYGNSCVADPLGRIVAKAGTVEQVVVADLDPGVIRAARDMLQMLRDRRPRV